MSRVANSPVEIPKGVETKLSDSEISVKGSKGTLTLVLHKLIGVAQNGESLKISAKDNSRQADAIAGTFRSLINNMIVGVSQGFEKKLELRGVGYRAKVQGKKLNLIISPVGQTYALLMAMGKSPSITIEEITSAMSAAVKDIFSTLSILGLLSSPGTTGQLKKSNTGNLIDPELEAMFDKAKGKKIKKEDVEEFWESLPDTQMFENIAGGEGLSFNEATKLGIGPTTNEK